MGNCDQRKHENWRQKRESENGNREGRLRQVMKGVVLRTERAARHTGRGQESRLAEETVRDRQGQA